MQLLGLGKPHSTLTPTLGSICRRSSACRCGLGGICHTQRGCRSYQGSRRLVSSNSNRGVLDNRAARGDAKFAEHISTLHMHRRPPPTD